MAGDGLRAAGAGRTADPPRRPVPGSSGDVSRIGQLPTSHFSHTAVRTEATADAVRRKGPHGRVYAVMKLSGRDTVQQGDREAVSRTGAFMVLDARPSVIQTETGGALVLDLPRERFEAVLGPSRLAGVLTVGAVLASTILANTHLRDLIRVSDRLSPDAATRTASIGIDGIAA